MEMFQLHSRTFIYFMMMLMAQSHIQLVKGAEAGDAVVATSPTRQLRQDAVLSIFVRRLDLAEQRVEAMDLRPDATFADVLAHPDLQGVEDIVVLREGQPFELVQPLADAGVCAESVIEIGRKAFDVETLFRIFDESDGTQELFRECIGFATYGEFARNCATLEQQRGYLEGSRRHGIFEVACDDTMRITSIIINWNHLNTTINWEAVNQLNHLEQLWLAHDDLQGSINFAQLPKSLGGLYLRGNVFTDVLHLEAVDTLFLNEVRVEQNQLTKDLVESIVLRVEARKQFLIDTTSLFC